ncbi:hypothetical protein K8R33_04590 [archaeon]|nr:hypothetical protein [archaeon]
MNKKTRLFSHGIFIGLGTLCTFLIAKDQNNSIRLANQTNKRLPSSIKDKISSYFNEKCKFESDLDKIMFNLGKVCGLAIPFGGLEFLRHQTSIDPTTYYSFTMGVSALTNGLTYGALKLGGLRKDKEDTKYEELFARLPKDKRKLVNQGKNIPLLPRLKLTGSLDDEISIIENEIFGGEKRIVIVENKEGQDSRFVYSIHGTYSENYGENIKQWENIGNSGVNLLFGVGTIDSDIGNIVGIGSLTLGMGAKIYDK